jgi:16S rRNA (cytosine967-C5)-methyltransferase
VAPGGRLVFCTCSLLPSEGEERVAGFLACTPEATAAAPDAPALGLDPAWADATGLRLRPDYWPERGGMDGFYAACLVRH